MTTIFTDITAAIEEANFMKTIIGQPHKVVQLPHGNMKVCREHYGKDEANRRKMYSTRYQP